MFEIMQQQRAQIILVYICRESAFVCVPFFSPITKPTDCGICDLWRLSRSCCCSISSRTYWIWKMCNKYAHRASISAHFVTKTGAILYPLVAQAATSLVWLDSVCHWFVHDWKNIWDEYSLIPDEELLKTVDDGSTFRWSWEQRIVWTLDKYVRACTRTRSIKHALLNAHKHTIRVLTVNEPPLHITIYACTNNICCMVWTVF